VHTAQSLHACGGARVRACSRAQCMHVTDKLAGSLHFHRSLLLVARDEDDVRLQGRVMMHDVMNHDDAIDEGGPRRVPFTHTRYWSGPGRPAWSPCPSRLRSRTRTRTYYSVEYITARPRGADARHVSAGSATPLDARH